MNYQFIHREYMNTGGGCMVAISQTWLKDENRTVWVYTNEEGSTITTVDYICNDIGTDDYDELQVATFNLFCPNTDSKYLALFVECQLYFFGENYKKYKTAGRMPYELIPKGLIVELPDGYVDWHEENIGSDYKTDGAHILLEVAWAKRERAIAENLSALCGLQKAFNHLNSVWLTNTEFNLNDMDAIKDYPFEKSFDELTDGVNEWIARVVKELADM